MSDRDIQSNVKSGRIHKIQQRNVPLESKATGAGCESPTARGQKVYHPTDASHVKTQKPVGINGRELASQANDWRAISNDPADKYNGGAWMADERRKMQKK